jgi:hypothetical protein
VLAEVQENQYLVFGVDMAFFGGSSRYGWPKEATQIVLRPETGRLVRGEERQEDRS